MICVVGVVWDVFYCMWQLEFAIIINNKNEPYISHHKLMCVHLLYIHVYINIRDLTWHMILLQRVFITIYYVLYCHYIQNILTVIILFTLLPPILHSLRVFWLSCICVSKSRDISICWLSIWRESHIIQELTEQRWELKFSLLDHPVINLTFLLFLIHLLDSL